MYCWSFTFYCYDCYDKFHMSLEHVLIFTCHLYGLGSTEVYPSSFWFIDVKINVQPVNVDFKGRDK